MYFPKGHDLSITVTFVAAIFVGHRVQILHTLSVDDAALRRPTAVRAPQGAHRRRCEYGHHLLRDVHGERSCNVTMMFVREVGCREREGERKRFLVDIVGVYAT
jgi:hypothetical protein